MRSSLLTELADLFALEAFEADERHDHKEADRLLDISAELHSRREDEARRDVLREER